MNGISTALAMVWTGIAVLAVGAIVWLTNTQVDYDPSGLMAGMDDTKPHLKSMGSGLVLIGAVIGGLGWAALAVCRQIGSVPVERGDLDREP
jgi:hypothetical protein